MQTRPCWAEIDTSALDHNYRLLRTLAGPAVKCLAIVKANAYGHGLEICAPAAVRAGASWLGVTSVEEGIAARRICPDARILVMGGVFPSQGEALVAHNLTPVVWEPCQLDEVSAAARTAGLAPASFPVHLEIDTGMSRQGIAPEAVATLLPRFAAPSPLRIEAVMTHLYASDEANGPKTPIQRERLAEALRAVHSSQPSGTSKPAILSAGATAELLAGGAEAIHTLAARYGLAPMVRLGLALYGLPTRFDPAFAAGNDPAALRAAQSGLKPVLAWKTRVVSVRSVPAGSEVGYNGTFVATEPMRLALLAIGYADGLDRQLGNRFSLLVRGQHAPLAGRVSMDQAVLDITEIEGVEPGEEVVILGSQGAESITAYDYAAATNTIPWEVFTRIGARVKRVAI